MPQTTVTYNRDCSRRGHTSGLLNYSMHRLESDVSYLLLCNPLPGKAWVALPVI